MSANTSTIAAAAPVPAAVRAPAARETRQTAMLISGALVLGGLLQVFIEPGPWALVVGVATAGLFLFVLSQVLPGRWRETLAGFRFTATLLFALSVVAVAGTLVLQNKPLGFYESRYGVVGALIVALRLDDIFHSLWFAGFIALFFAAILNSALLRWPVKLRNAGFFTCHVGLLTSLIGAGASAAFSVKGRVDLHAGGETARQVMSTRNGIPTGQVVPLGFALRLDKFDLVRYSPEYRVAYYELVGEGARLKASFDIGKDETASERALQKRHLLPSGDSFRIKRLQGDVGGSSGAVTNPAVVLEVTTDGDTRETGLMVAAKQDYVRTRRGALVFERREDEVKAFQSQVTALAGAASQEAVVSVNDPFTFNGWTFYQVNYDPKDPTYSGLEAVRDPGVNLVFLGFAVICVGVFYMFYVEPRLKRATGQA